MSAPRMPAPDEVGARECETADNGPEQGWNKFFRFQPVRFYRSLATQVEARDSAKSKRDFLTNMIRSTAVAIACSKWTSALLVIAVVGVVWWSEFFDANKTIATFTVVAAVATALGWWAMDQQNKIMLRQLSQADKTLELMRKERRAWLEIGVPIVTAFTNDRLYTLDIPIFNRGQTPAEVTFFAAIVHHEPDLLFDYDKAFTGSLVDPKSEFNRIYDEQIEAVITPIGASSSAVQPFTYNGDGPSPGDDTYLLAQLVYLDVFGNKHPVRGCYRFCPDTKRFQVAPRVIRGQWRQELIDNWKRERESQEDEK